ncbi:MAG: hypothetical protein H5T99_09370, partial [Moorella sp. (in: Bacteria)]|nr:hypothetical protein [Moorella sp. (in: firmicutes)]
SLLQELLPELEKEADLPAILQVMALACRDHLVWLVTGSATLLLLSGEPLKAAPLLPAQLWRCFQHIQATRVAVERNANRRLALEVLLFNLYRELAGNGGEGQGVGGRSCS